MSKILITGATGKLGEAVIKALLKKLPSNEIVALARDEAKATGLKAKGIEIRLGDYDSKEAIDNAMVGIDKVLLISGGNAQNGLEQHQNVVDAAKKAGVKCIAYTGRCLNDRSTLANTLMKRHFETEDYIKSSGLNYILFRNILYMDSMIYFLGEKVIDSGIFLSAGDGKGSFALRSDMGEAIGNVLAGNNLENRVYNFTNTETYSFYDVANVLSELSGKQVIYTPIEAETYKANAIKLNLPPFVIGMVVGFMEDLKNGQDTIVSDDLENALGRKPASLKEGLKIIYGF